MNNKKKTDEERERELQEMRARVNDALRKTGERYWALFPTSYKP